jgi:dihydrolipoamide dehydrogenase
MTNSSAKVDVVILGAGGAAYPGAFVLDRAGLRVVMADPIGNLGGDCLAEGCIPSKAVREASLIRAMAAKYSVFGLSGDIPEASWKGVLAHKDRVQNIRYDQHTEEIKASGVHFHTGRGRVVGERTVEIEDSAGTYRYEFRNLIVATGSRPHRLPIPGNELALTSHDFFRLGADLPFPNHLIVIGGGYIGVETASMLNNLGGKATVLEYTPQLLPGFDPELAGALLKALSKRIQVELRAEVYAIEDPGCCLRVRYRQDRNERNVTGDAVLMSTGREVILPEGLEKVGVASRGPIAVNELLQTENPIVYAPGDVNGRSMLFHSAVRQSLVAAHNILAGGQPADRMDFESVPHTVFTEPEIALVGLSEAQARDRYGRVETRYYDYGVDARAQIFDEMKGFMKLIFRPSDGVLVGAQIAGLDAAQLIAPLTLAVTQRLSARALTDAVFPHPMISEGINKAARQFTA